MQYREYTSIDSPWEEGVVKNVMVLGSKSKNKRHYTEAAMQKAASLYNDAPVYTDHPQRNEGRKAEDRFGVLKNVKYVEGALRGDLHFLTSHPLVPRIKEAQEKGLNLFGLSHVADGKGRKEKGITIVEEIKQVIEVDLVSNPATTHNLVEQEETPQEETSPDDTLAQGVLDAVCQAVDGVVRGEGTTDEKLAKIKDILDKHEAVSDEMPTEDKPEEAPTSEQVLAQEIKELREQIEQIAKREYKYLKPKTIGLQEQSGVPTDNKALAKWLRS